MKNNQESFNFKQGKFKSLIITQTDKQAIEDILINIAEQYDIDDIAGVDISFNKTAGIIKFNSDDMYREAIDTSTVVETGAAIGGWKLYKYLGEHPEQKEAIKKLIKENGLKYKDMLQQPLSSLMKRIPALSTIFKTVASTAANTAVDAAKGTILPKGTNVPTPKGTNVPTPKGTNVPTPKGTNVPTPKGTNVPTPKGTNVPTGAVPKNVGMLGKGLGAAKGFGKGMLGGVAGGAAGKWLGGDKGAVVGSLFGSIVAVVPHPIAKAVLTAVGAGLAYLVNDPKLSDVVKNWVKKGLEDKKIMALPEQIDQHVRAAMSAIVSGAEKYYNQLQSQNKKTTASSIDELLKIAEDTVTETADTPETGWFDEIKQVGSEYFGNIADNLQSIFNSASAVELQNDIADILIKDGKLPKEYKTEFIDYLTSFANTGIANLKNESEKMKKEEAVTGGTTPDQVTTKTPDQATAKTPDQATAKTPGIASGDKTELAESIQKAKSMGLSGAQIRQQVIDNKILEEGKVPGQLGKSIKPERSVIDPIIGKKPATTESIQYGESKKPSILTGFQGDPKLTTDPRELAKTDQWNPRTYEKEKPATEWEKTPYTGKDLNDPRHPNYGKSQTTPPVAPKVPTEANRIQTNNTGTSTPPVDPNTGGTPIDNKKNFENMHKTMKEFDQQSTGSYSEERDKYGFPVGAIAMTILKYGPEVYAVYKALKEIIFGNEQSGANEEKDIAATITNDIIKEGSFLDALNIAEKVFNAAKTIVEESPEANKLVKQLMEKTGKNPKEVIGSVQSIIKALDEFLNTVKDDQSIEKKSSIAPAEYLQVNSGTFVIRKGSTYYNELESILNKFAEEHTINNVSEIELEFSNKTGEVTFKKALELSPTSAIFGGLIAQGLPGESSDWVSTAIAAGGSALSNAGFSIGSTIMERLGFGAIGQIAAGALTAAIKSWLFDPKKDEDKNTVLGATYDTAMANPEVAKVLNAVAEKTGKSTQQIWVVLIEKMASSGTIEQMLVDAVEKG